MKPLNPLPPLAAPEPPGQGGHGQASRVRSATVVLAVIAAILFLNLGTLPARLSVGQMIVASLAVGFAVEAWRWIRRGVRRQARSEFARKVAEYGGGLYGTIAVATWLYLTGVDLLEDVVAAGSLGAFLSSISLGWLIAESIEAVKFGIQAALWPWYWLSGNATWMVAGTVWAIDGFTGRGRRWLAARRGIPPDSASAPVEAVHAERTPG